MHVQILICYPIIQCITKSKKASIYYSILWLFFICLKYSLFQAGVPFTVLRMCQLPFFQFSTYFGGTTAAFYPMEALGYYILGGGLIEWLLNIKTNGTNNEKKIELALIVGGGLGLLGTIVITYYVLRIAGADYFNNSLQPYNIWIAFSSLGFIVLLNKISLKITNYNVKKFFNWFSDKTLGVYVIQIFVRDAVIQCLREWLNNGAVYRYFVVFICTLVLSTATRCQVQVNIL